MHAPRTPAQTFALVGGIFLAALGVLSLVTNGLSFGQTSNPAEFIIWRVNGWDTILWMAMGALGILMSSRVDRARSYGALSALVFGVLAVWGFIDGGYSTVGIFAFGTVDNITHAVLAVLGAMVTAKPAPSEQPAGRAHRRAHPA
jgi:hypothetical protein